MSPPSVAAQPGLPQAVAHSQGQRSRERILDAAEKLMTDRGFAATGIAAISSESGLPASSIYWHFGSKVSLLSAVLERGHSLLLADLAAATGTRPSAAGLVEQAFRLLEGPRAGFVRLLTQVGLERRNSDPETLAVIERLHERGLEFLTSGFRTTFEAAAVARPEQSARYCAHFAIDFLLGSLLSHLLDPDRSNLKRSASQLVRAIEALAQTEGNDR